MSTKYCNYCGRRWPLEEFRASTSAKDGRAGRCRTCTNMVSGTKKKYRTCVICRKRWGYLLYSDWSPFRFTLVCDTCRKESERLPEPMTEVPSWEPLGEEKPCGRCQRTFRPLLTYYASRTTCPDCKDQLARERRAMQDEVDREWRGRLAVCPRCQNERYRWSSGQDASALYPQGVCDQCHRVYQQPFRHGITVGEAEARLEAQGRKCLICARSIDLENMAVDHDHVCCPGPQSCGKCIRGFLCNNCNSGIGFLGDSVSRLRAATAYLDTYSASRKKTGAYIHATA